LVRNDHPTRPSRVVVLGLGRFGASVVLELVRRGRRSAGHGRGPAGVLLLEEAGGERRLLPVWIGMADANVILLEQNGVSGPRRRPIS
jgi:hypothetical protein